jgi:hypothetical protein
MLSLNSIPIPNPDILSRLIEDEAVLVMPKQGQVKVLNEVGAAIWELVDGNRSIQQIIEGVCAQFEVDYGNVETDTLNFITDLIDREIVEIAA